MVVAVAIVIAIRWVASATRRGHLAGELRCVLSLWLRHGLLSGSCLEPSDLILPSSANGSKACGHVHAVEGVD